MDRGSAEPVCSLCSKPIRAGRLRLYEGGAFYHVRCRSRQLQLKALEQVDRAQAAKERASSLVRRASSLVRRTATTWAASSPAHFLIDGDLAAWDAEARVLRLEHDDRAFPVAAMVTGVIPPKGTRITVSGQVDAEGRWVITNLVVRRP